MQRSRRVLLAVLGSAILICAPAAARIIDLDGYRFDTALGEPQLPPDLVVSQNGYAEHGYFLVQTDQPVTAEWRVALADAGATLYGYLTQFTYLVGLDAAAQHRVAALEGTLWMGPFHPAYKLSAAIGSVSFESPRRAQDPNLTLMVRVFRNLDQVAAAIADLGGRVLDRTDDGFSRRLLVSAPAELLHPIARIHDVWWIEEQPEFLLMNNTTRWVAQSNVSGWTPLWDHGINGAGQIATIMDSGVDYNSCWFRENGNAPPGPAHRKIIDYAAFGGNPYDGCDIGHGSHVAGTMAGDQSYINPGNYNYNGMAYKSKFTVQDVGTDDTWACTIGTVAVPSSLTAAFNTSYGLAARVHQNSWGSTSNAYDGYCVDIDNAMWNHKDFLVCFAAGNSGPGSGTVGSPGTAKDCLTVGSCRQAPQQDVMASYSSRGPASDNRYKPTVTAPGGEDPSFITSVNNDPGNPPAPTCATASSPFQGTSMATPCVSGMALNTRQYFVEGFYPDGEADPGHALTPSAALIKAAIVSSTADMATPDIPNNNEGWGRILMDNALYFTGDTRETIAEDVEPGLTTAESWSLDFDVDSGAEPLVVTVVWSDYPGTSGGGVALVNDLDITLHAPGGATYRGNHFSGGFSATGGVADRRNVEECARIAGPSPGTWTLEVYGYNIPHGPQPFAVMICGAFASWPPGSGAAVPAVRLGADHGWVQASPNPFVHQTHLRYQVPAGHAGPVQVVITDLEGRLVRSLVAKGQRPGIYAVSWNGLDDGGRPVADGVYFARMTAGSESTATRVVVRR